MRLKTNKNLLYIVNFMFILLGLALFLLACNRSLACYIKTV